VVLIAAVCESDLEGFCRLGMHNVLWQMVPVGGCTDEETVLVLRCFTVGYYKAFRFGF
jgi:hypothetical protein